MADVKRKGEDRRSGHVHVGSEMAKAISRLAGDSDAAALAFRAAQVEKRWAAAIEHVYKGNFRLVLEHTNAVYIMKEQNRKILAVYLDDSVIRSDVKVRQELVKMALAKEGELIDEFKVYPSKFGMKARHPYKGKQEQESAPARKPRALTADEEKAVEEAAALIDDPVLKDALVRAMRANLAING